MSDFQQTARAEYEYFAAECRIGLILLGWGRELRRNCSELVGDVLLERMSVSIPPFGPGPVADFRNSVNTFMADVGEVVIS